VPALDALYAAGHDIAAVYTQPPRPAGRGQRLRPSAVQARAEALGLAVRAPSRLRDPAEQGAFAALGAEAAVVAAYGLILPQAVLDAPRRGCLNIHASLLPRWRGAAPIQRAILAGDKETGITIMQMDEGLDTGDMLLRHVCPIGTNDTALTLQDKLAEIGAAAILETLRLLQSNLLNPVKQDNDAASYAPKLTKGEARIEWRQDARQIERAVRAYNPFPVCHARLNGVAIKIWQAALCTDKRGDPGRVIEVNKRGITVACGNGALRLEVLQRPGGKAQPAEQFLQAVPVEVGDDFDAS
jgi:methionyl-tRNA formyltransferase